MAELTQKKRRTLKDATFALPGRRFPIPDKTHAAVAKSYASRMYSKGQLSAGQKAQVDVKADKKLGLRG